MSRRRGRPRADGRIGSHHRYGEVRIAMPDGACISLRPAMSRAIRVETMADEIPTSVIGAPSRGTQHRAAAAFIFVTILLDMFALGLILPVLPKLVESFVDSDTASAARIFGLFGTAWAAMQFVFSPVLGGLWCCCRISASDWTTC